MNSDLGGFKLDVQQNKSVKDLVRARLAELD